MEALKVEHDSNKIQQLLGSKLYSSEWQWICELAQNSTDAYISAGITDQWVFAKFNKIDYDTVRFSIRDYGPSIDTPENIITYLCTLLKSSKETDNQQVGQFGIGKISIAAYKKKWFYYIYKDGLRRTLNLEEKEESEGGGIYYNLSEGEPTTEKDGVEFNITVNKNEVKTLLENVKDKLKFFTNVKIVMDFHCLKLINNYIRKNVTAAIKELREHNEFNQLYRNDLFIALNSYSNSKSVEISNYNYAYETDLKIAIVPRLDSSKIIINPNRETFIINDSFKEELQSKITASVKYLYDLYISTHPKQDYQDIQEYIKYLSSSEYFNCYVTLKKDTIFDCERLFEKHGYTEFNKATYKGLKGEFFNMLKDKYHDYLNTGYEIKKSKNLRYSGYQQHKFERNATFIYSDKQSSAKTTFIHSNYSSYIIARQVRKLDYYDTFIPNLDVALMQTNELYKIKIEKIIKVAKVIVEDYNTAYLLDYDAIVVEKKKKESSEKEDNVISCLVVGFNSVDCYTYKQNINISQKSGIFFPHSQRDENKGLVAETYNDKELIKIITILTVADKVIKINKCSTLIWQTLLTSEESVLYNELSNQLYACEQVKKLDNTLDSKGFVNLLIDYFTKSNLLDVDLLTSIENLHTKIIELDVFNYLDNGSPQHIIDLVKEKFNIK
jgi:hypothetical protein